ncbi:MAG: LytTR family DNA-binding domain-containing protein [Oscillospiraceae bacterium]|nr:LytTR family DNA-binding domain-containing protein [Oscillospiraceae bacterium]
MIRIAVCDDHESEVAIVSQNVRTILKKMNIRHDIKAFTDANALLCDNRESAFDVVFLDLDMPQISGMDAASKINEHNSSTEIVFVTNHDELVYKAFRFKALGFIRKKHLETEIAEIIKILLEHIMRKRKYIIIRNSGVDKKININDIIYMKSDTHYIDIYTSTGKEVLRRSLNDIEEEYSSYGFIRIHVRYLVNYRYIYSIEKNTIILNDRKQLPLSRSKIKDVKDSFQFFLRRV